jgi:hypothetical protein
MKTIALAVCMLVGCSSSSGSSNAVADCNALAQSLCTKIVSCEPTKITQAECLSTSTGSSGLNCASATSYSDPGDACENALAAEPCASLEADTTPSACANVVH